MNRGSRALAAFGVLAAVQMISITLAVAGIGAVARLAVDLIAMLAPSSQSSRSRPHTRRNRASPKSTRPANAMS